MRTRWKCHGCYATGTVRHRKDELAYTVVQAIRDQHRAKMLRCHAGDDSLQVTRVRHETRAPSTTTREK